MLHLLYPPLAQFRTLVDAMLALLFVATTGEALDEFPPRWADGLAPNIGQFWPNLDVFGSPNGIAFFFGYLSWIYLALILLLNLLIAQMTDIYDELERDSVRLLAMRASCASHIVPSWASSMIAPCVPDEFPYRVLSSRCVLLTH